MDDLRPPRDDTPTEPSAADAPGAMPAESVAEMPADTAAAAPGPILSWTPPGQDAATPVDLTVSVAFRRLDVRAAFNRTVDTFLADWPVFMLLSIPLTLLGVILSILPPSNDPGDPFASLRDFGVVIAAVNAFSAVSIALAVDDARAGRTVSFGRAAERSAGPTVIAVFSSIIVGLCVVGLIVLPTTIGLIAGGVVAVVLIGGGVVLTFYALFRWWLSVMAIALDGAGPLKALGRSWLVMKGNLWPISLAALAVFAIVVPWNAAGLLFEFADYPGAGIAIGVAGTLVVGPLAMILPAVLYGELTGRWDTAPASVVEPAHGPAADDERDSVPEHDLSPKSPSLAPLRLTPDPAPTLPATPGRRGYLAVVAILGVVLLVPAVVVAAPTVGDFIDYARYGSTGIPLEDRGRVVAGGGASAADACLPSDRAETFSTGADIYLGAWLRRTVGPESHATVHVFVDGNEEFTGPLEVNSGPIVCYATEPLRGLGAGVYRILIDDEQGVLAEGTFEIR